MAVYTHTHIACIHTCACTYTAHRHRKVWLFSAPQVKVQRRWWGSTCRKFGTPPRRWIMLHHPSPLLHFTFFTDLSQSILVLGTWSLGFIIIQTDISPLSLSFSQDCTICMETLGGTSVYRGPGVGNISWRESVGRFSTCGHEYHLQCLVAMYNNGNKDGSLQCPTCKTIYGVKTGNQPPGKMEYHIIPHSLPGHPDCKTIRIIYSIPPGIQVHTHTHTHTHTLVICSKWTKKSSTNLYSTECTGS